MIDDKIPEVDPITRIERQLERGSLFTHTALSKNAEEAHEVASLAFGLVDLLVKKGLIAREDVLESTRAVRAEMDARGETTGPGVALRVDAPVEPGRETVLVNCQERLPICKAICCKLSFALTAEEVEASHVKWDLGMPYHIRQEASGFCTHLRDDPRGCGVYEHRPTICRRYSCAGDERIWKDFHGMVLNDEWINAHLWRDDSAARCRADGTGRAGFAARGLKGSGTRMNGRLFGGGSGQIQKGVRSRIIES